MATLEQCLSFEANLENGLVRLLSQAGLPNVHTSRGSANFATPFIAVTVSNGGVSGNHQHIVRARTETQEALLFWDTYAAVITTEIATQRPTESGQPPESTSHTTLLAMVRKNLQMILAVPIWQNYETIALISDIRETGTTDQWNEGDGDGNSIDHTVISWSVRHNVNPLAWPTLGELENL